MVRNNYFILSVRFYAFAIGEKEEHDVDQIISENQSSNGTSHIQHNYSQSGLINNNTKTQKIMLGNGMTQFTAPSNPVDISHNIMDDIEEPVTANYNSKQENLHLPVGSYIDEKIRSLQQQKFNISNEDRHKHAVSNPSEQLRAVYNNKVVDLDKTARQLDKSLGISLPNHKQSKNMILKSNSDMLLQQIFNADNQPNTNSAPMLHVNNGTKSSTVKKKRPASANAARSKERKSAVEANNFNQFNPALLF